MRCHKLLQKLGERKMRGRYGPVVEEDGNITNQEAKERQALYSHRGMISWRMRKDSKSVMVEVLHA
jgi:hypothetical protein